MTIKSLLFSSFFVVALATSAVAGGPSSGQRTRVIVTLAPGAALPAAFEPYARSGRLDSVDAQVLDVPDSELKALASDPAVRSVRRDRLVVEQDFRTAIGSGSFFANRNLGYTGKGISVAVIDSGINPNHDDLRHHVAGFVDFVNHQLEPYDDNGHGTHVAGIIAGDGFDSGGQQAGIAPDAQIVALKVLDAAGQGSVSNVIAALDWVAQHAARYNIRIVNVSLGAAINESYTTDPLTLAAKALVDRGIIVVAAAGNRGMWNGREAFGGIGAPGNAPWVLTVGASSSMGTLTRTDDVVADFSSRGPTRRDLLAKPDIVAGGVGVISATSPGSFDYNTKPQFLIDGTIPTATFPYEVKTGTSMAAPAVTGTLALMLEANSRLTPNFAKGIVEYTAQWQPMYSALEQGAGFLNTLGAVRLAAFYAHAKRGDRVPVESIWSRSINWGNHRIAGGVLLPSANAWPTSVTWGATALVDGDDQQNIVWGTNDDGTVAWGVASNDQGAIVWSSDDENIVWGTACGGDDCRGMIWSTADDENIVWGTSEDEPENVMWDHDDAAAASGTPNPSFGWFLNRQHDAIWLVREFGDSFLTRKPHR